MTPPTLSALLCYELLDEEEKGEMLPVADSDR